MSPYSTKQKRFRQWTLMGWENSNSLIPVAQVRVLPGVFPRERDRFGGHLGPKECKERIDEDPLGVRPVPRP